MGEFEDHARKYCTTVKNKHDQRYIMHLAIALDASNANIEAYIKAMKDSVALTTPKREADHG